MARKLLSLRWWITGGIILLMLGSLIYNLYWQALPQPLAAFLPELPAAKSTDRVLVLSPHPDDETIGSVGYLTDAIKAGAQVWVVLVTDGNKHGQEKKRYAEFNQVMDLIGVAQAHRLFLGYPDGELNQVKATELTAKFKAVAQPINPTIVLIPHPRDSHPDHRITGKVADAIFTAPIKVFHYLVHFPHFPFPQKFVPDDYLLPPLRLISTQEQWYKRSLNNRVVDLKLEALLKYKSQLKNPFLRKLFYAAVRQNELFTWSGSTSPKP